MGEVQKYSIIEELRKADQQLQGSPSLLGMSMLTYPNYINSMRTTMFVSHLKQFLTLESPESPFVFTNTENIVGKYSNGYKKAKGNLRVVRKVEKFKDLYGSLFNVIGQPKIYQMFVFDEDKCQFDVITRKDVENLTENFGYSYDNTVIDSLVEGDVVKKDTVLYHSPSYDEDMNYGYGKNITVAYTLDPFTSEDGAVCDRSFQHMMTSIETEHIPIGLNNNDYLINLYGDNETYKPLPYIGEVVSDILAVSRRQINSQLLFDFRDDIIQDILDSDTFTYCDKDVEIIDYTIYCNADEWNDSPFYTELNALMISQEDYYRAIYETCDEIIKSGADYTQNVDYLYKRSQEFIDKKKKWRENDNTFGNIEMEVTTKRLSPIAKACKWTGRFGNKCVISEIREDDEMPYTKDGRRVDLLINLLAIINRTTSAVLMEIFINGCSYQVRQQMIKYKTREEKANLFFEYLRIWNEKEYKHYHKKYTKYSAKKKDEFLQDVIDGGIYVNIVPMWEDTPVFYKCINVLQKFDFLHEDTLYVKKWGREIRFLNDTWVGELYVMKLKQSERRGFSVRSTGAVNMKGLPTRSFKSRQHLEQYSSSCIRFGEYESLNFSIGIDPEDISLFNALYRTSLKGRKDVAKLMFTDEDDDEQLKGVIDKTYTSRVAEIFNVYLRCMGMSMDFVDEDDYLRTFGSDEVNHHLIDGKHYMCTDYQAYIIERINDIADEILEEHPVMLAKELRKEVKKRLKEYDYINGSYDDEEDTLRMIKKLLMSKTAVAKYEKELLEATEDLDEDSEITVEQDEYDEKDEESDY